MRCDAMQCTAYCQRLMLAQHAVHRHYRQYDVWYAISKWISKSTYRPLHYLCQNSSTIKVRNFSLLFYLLLSSPLSVCTYVSSNAVAALSCSTCQQNYQQLLCQYPPTLNLLLVIIIVVLGMIWTLTCSDLVWFVWIFVFRILYFVFCIQQCSQIST